MIRNRKLKKNSKILLAIFTAGFLFSIMNASAIPQMIVECDGCNNKNLDSVTGNYTFWVNQNANQKTIVLKMVDLTTESGQEYSWMQNGVPVKNQSDYSFVVTGNVNLVASLKVGIVIVKKNVNIILVAPTQDNTLPEWGLIPFSWDEKTRKAEYVVGDRVVVSVNIYGDCKKPCAAALKVFVNSNEVKGFSYSIENTQTATIAIGPGVTPGQYTVKWIYYFLNDLNGQTNEREFQITVISKPAAAPEIMFDYDRLTILSYTSFSATVRKKTENGNSNFIKSCTITFRNESSRNALGVIVPGNVIGSPQAISTVFGQALSPVYLYPKDPGVYSIEANCRDSFGNVVVANDTIPVGFGKTRNEKPHIVVNKTQYCRVNENCTIDYSKTRDYMEYNVSISAKCYIVTGVAKQNINKVPEQKGCGNKKFVSRFTDNQDVRLEMRYQWTENNKFVYSEKSEETISVIVTQNGAEIAPSVSATINSAVQSAASVQAENVPQDPQVEETYADYRLHKSPGMDGFASIVIFAIAVLARREDCKINKF